MSLNRNKERRRAHRPVEMIPPDTSASFGGRGPLFSNPHYVYLLECGDGSIYVGCTADIVERFSRHCKGNVLSTCSRLPVKLIMYHVFNDKYLAFRFEKYLKSGSGRAFAKRHLICNQE